MNRYWITVVVLITLLISFVPRGADMRFWVMAQEGGNLLTNGSFEPPYSAENGIPEIFLPQGWHSWWTDTPHNEPWQNLRPEWSNVSRSAFPYRVLDGEYALRYFKGWGSFTAGVYQVVTGITPGTNLTFTAWGQAWHCQRYEDCHEGDRVWSDPPDAAVTLKIGIDPNGGTDPFSPNVVWSPGAAALDQYQQFTVTATAQAEQVTVFLYASQVWAAENQDAYWDMASLTVGGEGGGGGAAAPQYSAFTQTVTPMPDGSIVHTVRPNETLSGIALAYGVDVNTIRALNGMGENESLIIVGQQLLIREAGAEDGEESNERSEGTAEEQGAAEAEPAGEVEEQPPDEGPAPTEAPPPRQPQPAAPTTGSVCALVYTDSNANRFREAGEPLAAGAVITLSSEGSHLGTYTTTGSDEPYCFENLEPGREYSINVSPPSGLSATTPHELMVIARVGTPVSVEFGVSNVPIEAAETLPTSPAEADSVAGTQETAPSLAETLVQALIKVSGIVVIVAAAGIGLVFLLLRR